MKLTKKLYEDYLNMVGADANPEDIVRYYRHIKEFSTIESTVKYQRKLGTIIRKKYPSLFNEMFKEWKMARRG